MDSIWDRRVRLGFLSLITNLQTHGEVTVTPAGASRRLGGLLIPNPRPGRPRRDCPTPSLAQILADFHFLLKVCLTTLPGLDRVSLL